MNKEFLNWFEVLDKEFFFFDIFEIRIRLCNDDIKKEYVFKMYDFLLNGLYWGIIKKKFVFLIINNILLENWKERVRINRIYIIFFLNIDY